MSHRTMPRLTSSVGLLCLLLGSCLSQDVLPSTAVVKNSSTTSATGIETTTASIILLNSTTTEPQSVVVTSQIVATTEKPRPIEQTTSSTSNANGSSESTESVELTITLPTNESIPQTPQISNIIINEKNASFPRSLKKSKAPKNATNAAIVMDFMPDYVSSCSQ